MAEEVYDIEFRSKNLDRINKEVKTLEDNIIELSNRASLLGFDKLEQTAKRQLNAVTKETLAFDKAIKESNGDTQKQVQILSQYIASVKNITSSYRGLKTQIDANSNTIKQESSSLKEAIRLRDKLISQSRDLEKMAARKESAGVFTKKDINLVREDAKAQNKLATEVDSLTKQYESGKITLDEYSKKVSTYKNNIDDGSKKIHDHAVALEKLHRGAWFVEITKRAAMYAAAFGGLYAVTGAVREGVSAFLEYDKQARVLAAVLGENVAIGRMLEDQIIGLGEAYGGTFEDINKVAAALARAGVVTDKVIASTEVVIKLAKLTGDTIDTSADAVISYTQVFKNLDIEILGDKLAYVANASRLSTQDINTFSNYALAAGTAVGLTIDTINGLAVSFSNAGFNASTIGTQIRKFTTILTDSSPQVTDFFNQIGLSQKAMQQLIASGKSDQVVKDFATRLAGISTDAFAKITAGMDILTLNVIQAIRNNAPEINKAIEESITKSSGELGKASIIVDSYATSWERLKNVAVEAATIAGTASERALGFLFSISDTKVNNTIRDTVGQLKELYAQRALAQKLGLAGEIDRTTASIEVLEKKLVDFNRRRQLISSFSESGDIFQGMEAAAKEAKVPVSFVNAISNNITEQLKSKGKIDWTQIQSSWIEQLGRIAEASPALAKTLAKTFDFNAIFEQGFKNRPDLENLFGTLANAAEQTSNSVSDSSKKGSDGIKTFTNALKQNIEATINSLTYLDEAGVLRISDFNTSLDSLKKSFNEVATEVDTVFSSKITEAFSQIAESDTVRKSRESIQSLLEGVKDFNDINPVLASVTSELNSFSDGADATTESGKAYIGILQELVSQLLAMSKAQGLLGKAEVTILDSDELRKSKSELNGAISYLKDMEKITDSIGKNTSKTGFEDIQAKMKAQADIVNMASEEFSLSVGTTKQTEKQIKVNKTIADYIKLLGDYEKKKQQLLSNYFSSVTPQLVKQQMIAEETAKALSQIGIDKSANQILAEQALTSMQDNVANAFAQGIENGIATGDWDSLFKNVSVAVGQGIGAAIGASYGGATGALIGSAIGGGLAGSMFGGGDSGPSAQEKWLERQTRILEQIRDNTDKLNEFDLTGTALQTGLSSLGSQDVAKQVSEGVATAIIGYSAQQAIDTGLGGGKASLTDIGEEYISEAGSALTQFQDVIYAIGQASGDTTLQLQNATNALMAADIGFDGTEESYDAITDQVQSYNSTLFDLQQRMKEAVKSGDELEQLKIAKEIEDFTTANQDLLTGILDNYDAFQLLGEQFSETGEDIDDTASKLKSFSDSLKGMVDQAQSLIDQIRGQRGLPGQGLEYYQGRFAQEQATLASALSAFQGDQTSDNLAALQRAFSRYMDIAGQYSQTTLDVLKSSPEAIAIQEMIANTTEQFQGQLMTVDDLMLQQLEIIAANTGDLASAAGFSSGGYTGDGTKYQPSEIVPKGEYVVPQSMSYLFPALEGIRKGYANSGGTMPVFPIANNMSYGSAELIAEIRALGEENRRMNDKLSNIENNTGSTANYTRATAENPLTASGLKRTWNRYEGAMA